MALPNLYWLASYLRYYTNCLKQAMGSADHADRVHWYLEVWAFVNLAAPFAIVLLSGE